MIYIFWTCRDAAEAKTIIHKLLEKHLIACASIFPEVESIYRWEGKIEEAKEAKVLLKTLAHHFEQICATIQSSSSYQVSEIAQIDAAKVNTPYLSWVTQETRTL
jgi:periplasmic divalent cation tolerance protein